MDGNAIVWCDGAFQSPNGKTAHGLVRFTRRYRVLSVVDSDCAGADAGELLDGKRREIPVVATLELALKHADELELEPTHLVVGIAPDGGAIDRSIRAGVLAAIEAGLNVDCGLHDFLAEDSEISAAAEAAGVKLRDVRRPPHRAQLHHFTGRIEEVGATVVALLGTDSAVGKRTTAWMLVDALNRAGRKAALVGTGQTAWMQGVQHGIVLDSLVNDFVAGELEYAVWACNRDLKPEVIVVEGQGSLMNPAYPGGLEILAATRPAAIVLQHAPGRLEYDGFPGYPIHPLKTQIEALELVGGRPVVAITVNHQGLPASEIDEVCDRIEAETGLPTCDPVVHGADPVVKAVLARGPKGAK